LGAACNQGNRGNNFLFVIPNLIWNPAIFRRDSVLPEGIFGCAKDATASDFLLVSKSGLE
jgi:hypothetical protein